MENAYESLKHSYVQLEGHNMELQSKLSMKQHMNRSASNSSMLMTMTSTSLRGHASSSSGGAREVNQNRRRQSSATTANVDIEVPAAIMIGSGKVKTINETTYEPIRIEFINVNDNDKYFLTGSGKVTRILG